MTLSDYAYGHYNLLLLLRSKLTTSNFDQAAKTKTMDHGDLVLLLLQSTPRMMHTRTLHLFIAISTILSVLLLNLGHRALSHISTHEQQRHQLSLALKSFATTSTKKAATQDGFIDKPVSRQRPPLESIVQGYRITGDASWLLDFSIVGFPKCGTSTLMFHLQSHPQVAMFSDERCDMSYSKQALLARDLYTNFSDQDGLRRGIKCPMDLENTKLAMPNYQRYFPKTNYIVGIRHPVLW